MKGMKFIITLATAAILLGAAICAIILFQEELLKLYNRCKEFCCKTIGIKKEDEYADFADV